MFRVVTKGKEVDEIISKFRTVWTLGTVENVRVELIRIGWQAREYCFCLYIYFIFY